MIGNTIQALGCGTPSCIFNGLFRGLSQIIFPTVSVIMTLRGGGSEGVTLIFTLRLLEDDVDVEDWVVCETCSG